MVNLWLHHISVETKTEKDFLFFFVHRASCALIENILAASELKWIQISEICLNAELSVPFYITTFIFKKSLQNTLFPGFSVWSHTFTVGVFLFIF